MRTVPGQGRVTSSVCDTIQWVMPEEGGDPQNVNSTPDGPDLC